MKMHSVFNDVLGPVMHGPSSSHTAASQRIGLMARELLGGEPASATFIFDRNGSFGRVFRFQGSDLAFASGVMGWPLADDRFLDALDIAQQRGIEISFTVGEIPGEEHPNAVEIDMASRDGHRLRAKARSVGGGSVEIVSVDDWPVLITGEAHELLVTMERGAEPPVRGLLARDGEAVGEPNRAERGEQVLLHARSRSALDAEARRELESLAGLHLVRTASPVVFVRKGEALFSSGAEMVAAAEERGCSLGQLTLAYEAKLLGLPEKEVAAEMGRRFDVMEAAVRKGLDGDSLPAMQLLSPTARDVYRAEAEGRLAIGGLHTRAAARAMAVMHVNGGMGLVCAAPTGGSAGAIPGVVVTLAEERGLSRDKTVLALFAASAVGLVFLGRGTFAAEEAGCQVEIGAAGAMAAAAVVEAAGGNASQAADAAAVSLQNTMGSVCDLVQGVVEIPCHTRNAVAASSAFVCADLILGGYVNPIPLDETIDASIAVGRSLPPELRCTARGGLAATPSAQTMPRRRE